MTISGFSMVKNAEKLNYPFSESVKSLLPLVDEFVIALGDCDEDDNTIRLIDAIESPKIKVINTKWDVKEYPHGSILAQQTDVAKEHCTGDWLFYIQADEVVHEKEFDIIRKSCEQFLHDDEVDGLLFKYIHFFGDYDHAFTSNHAWYRHEIRIVRNKKDIHSWKDAQSFRRIPNFNKKKYLLNEGTFKLKVALVQAHIYHYGWVRPPKLMQKKQTHFTSCYGDNNVASEEMIIVSEIDFGPMMNVPLFKGSHPKVMKERIKKFDWADQLNYSNRKLTSNSRKRHNRFKYRFMSFIEGLFFKEFGLFTFKNYKLLKNK